MSLILPQELEVALVSVRMAALVCRRVQQRLAGDHLQKEDRSPVTVADFASQAVICRMLQTAFPQIPIMAEEDAAALRKPENAPFLQRIGEELAGLGIAATAEEICEWVDCGNGNAQAECYWTLDPIDGTKGFLRGDQYAVSLALLRNGKLELGLLACPNLPVAAGKLAPASHSSESPEAAECQKAEESEEAGVVLFAAADQGAWQVPLFSDVEEPQALRASSVASPASARFCESFESQHSAHGTSQRVARRLGISVPPLRIDSQAKYALVARGEAEIYLRLPSKRGYVEKIWDHAGGALLVQEAGGRVTDLDGQPLDWTQGQTLQTNRGLLATNGILHEDVLSVLRQVEADRQRAASRERDDNSFS